MSANENTCAAMVQSEPFAPEFERIIAKLSSLESRLRSVRETSVLISDALIGVQNTGKGYDDCAKPTSPDYFVIKCFDLIDEFGEEIERLENVNEAMMKTISCKV